MFLRTGSFSGTLGETLRLFALCFSWQDFDVGEDYSAQDNILEIRNNAINCRNCLFNDTSLSVTKARFFSASIFSKSTLLSFKAFDEDNNCGFFRSSGWVFVGCSSAHRDSSKGNSESSSSTLSSLESNF